MCDRRNFQSLLIFQDKSNPRKCHEPGIARSESSSSRSGFPVACLALPVAAAASSTSPPAPTFSSGAKNKKRSGVPCRQYEKLGLQDFQIYQCLMNYKLEEDQMRRLGFPMESELHPGKACVYQDPEFGSRSLGEVDDDDYRDDEQRSRWIYREIWTSFRLLKNFIHLGV